MIPTLTAAIERVIEAAGHNQIAKITPFGHAASRAEQQSVLDGALAALEKAIEDAIDERVGEALEDAMRQRDRED